MNDARETPLREIGLSDAEEAKRAKQVAELKAAAVWAAMEKAERRDAVSTRIVLESVYDEMPGSLYCERDGDKVTFGRTNYGQDQVRMAVHLENDEGLSIDPAFAAARKAQGEWRKFLEEVGLSDLRLLVTLIPPSYVRTDTDRRAYVEDIADDRVKIWNCGVKCRETVRKAICEDTTRTRGGDTPKDSP